eukprot:jgi/Ulvmu1/5137/UM021_0154.1
MQLIAIGGIQPLNNAIALLWLAAERHQWNLVCKVGALCCIAITRKLLRIQLTDESCDRGKTYIVEAKTRRFHPGALAALQFIAFLSLASSRGRRWQVPDALLQGLHHFCSVPRDTTAIQFALEQLCQPTSLRDSSAIISGGKRRGIAGVDAARAIAAWIAPHKRARALQGSHEVSSTLVSVLKVKQDERLNIYSHSNRPRFSITLCTDAACWNLLLNMREPERDQVRCSSIQDAALLWEDTRRLINDAYEALKNAEMPLVALQLDILAGGNLQDIRPMCVGANGADVLKMRCLYNSTVSPPCTDVRQKDTDRASNESKSRGRKRKQTTHNDQLTTADHQHILRKLMKMDAGCCAAIGLVDVRKGVTPEQMSWFLSHLDNSLISLCTGGIACVEQTLQAVAYGLIEHSTAACRAIATFSKDVMHFSASPRKEQSTDIEAMQAISNWTEVLAMIVKRRWWFHDEHEQDMPDLQQGVDAEGLLHRAVHVCNQLGCQGPKVLGNLIVFLVVMHGPCIEQVTGNACEAIISYLNNAPGGEAQMRARCDHDTLTAIYHNMWTLCQQLSIV